MTEGDLRPLTIKNSNVYIVHCGKIMDLEAIGQLRDNAIVHVVNNMPGGGKKKGPRKSSQSDRGAHDKSSLEADVNVGLMEKDCRIGRRGWNEGVIGKMLEQDDDETQDMMRRLRSSIQVSVGDGSQTSTSRIQEAAARTQTSNEDSGRRGGESDRTTATETGGYCKRTTEARRGGERDGATDCSIRNESWLRQM